MTKLLLHICCAPCSAFSVPALRREGLEVTGYYYNPNIHPEAEYRRREDALRAYLPSLEAEVIYEEKYDCTEYFDVVASAEEDRCRHCYELRLGQTAREAKRRSIGAFSTTLLFSIYQKHDLLREVGEKIAGEESVTFLYRDLRPGWREGLETYRPSGLYRQNYCGCVFSEKERLERKKGKPE
jgi:predicted adenine nucleotide alpha hydrolase (AANH) superfamily ATPase